MAFADVDDRDGLVAPWGAEDREPGVEPADDWCDLDVCSIAYGTSTRGYDS